MIIGYQVQNKQGKTWQGRASSYVMTEQSALKDLTAAREAQPDAGFFIKALIKGDVIAPEFEQPLAASSDQYKVLSVSVAHLERDDSDHDDLDTLDRLADEPECNMIMGRETGWCVKLYADEQGENKYAGMSDAFHAILRAAHQAGYRMVEFDVAGEEYALFPTF